MVRFVSMPSKEQKPERQGRQRQRPPRQPPAAFARHRSDDADAFFPDPGGGPARAPDALAEQIAEDYVQAATTGEDQSEKLMDAAVPEEIGGPFIETAAADELATTIDGTNPIDAVAEPLPRAVAGLVTNPPLDDELDAEAADDQDAREAAEDREDDLRASSEIETPPPRHTD
jgi:hypothetical protein